MRITPTVRYTIQSNHQSKEYSPWIECSSYDGNEYHDINKFDYSEIFKSVLINVPVIEGKTYAVPTTKEDFMRSELWKDLGFEISEDFTIVTINRKVMIEYYMTYGQYAEYTIYFDSKQVVENKEYFLRNAMDLAIFDYPLYTEEFEPINGDDYLDDMIAIYKRLEKDGDLKKSELRVALETYHATLNLSDDEASPVDDDYLNLIYKAIEPFL